MKRLIGFSLLWLGIGMIIMLFISNSLIAIGLIAFCLVVGYNLFIC